MTQAQTSNNVKVILSIHKRKEYTHEGYLRQYIKHNHHHGEEQSTRLNSSISY